MKNTTDIDLRTRCREHGIYIAAHNPTLEEVQHAVEARLAEDKQNPPQHQCDREEWTVAIESLERFQTILRAEVLLRSEPLQKPGQNRPTVSNQPHTDRPETGQNWPTTGQTLPNTGQARPNTGQQPANPSAESFPSIESIKSIPPALDANDNQEETEEEEDAEDAELSEEDEEDQEEAEFWEDHHAEVDLLNDTKLDLQAALTGRNRFAQLTDKEQAAVVALLETHDSRHLVKILREPPPIGLNFKISKSALNDFAKRYQKKEHERREKQKLENAEQILDAEDSDRAFHQMADRILKLRLLTSPDADLKSIDAIVTILAKLRKQASASDQPQRPPPRADAHSG